MEDGYLLNRVGEYHFPRARLEIYLGGLPVLAIYSQLTSLAGAQNFGANYIFNGVVRKEEEINGLSFDIYEPLLVKWFESWAEKIQGTSSIYMAHSKGDVPCGESSFIYALLSKKRDSSLELFEEFIQDFKSKAPIWKFDLKHNQRSFARMRSSPLPYSGLLRKGKNGSN